MHIGVMLDTKGPEIRTGKICPVACPDGKIHFTKVYVTCVHLTYAWFTLSTLSKGQTIEVGTDYDKLGTPEYLPCSYKSLPKSVVVGGKILVADGSLSLEVRMLY